MIIREVVPEAMAGERVDRIVAMVTGVSRSEVAALIDAGAVLVGGAPVRSRSARPGGRRPGGGGPPGSRGGPAPGGRARGRRAARVRRRRPARGRQAGRAGRPPRRRSAHRHARARPARALPRGRRGRGDPGRPGIVHRLDKGTSGLLLVARTQRAYDALVAALSARAVHRRYRALVWGTVACATRADRRPDRPLGARADPDGGRRAGQGGPDALRGARGASPSRWWSRSSRARSRPAAPTRSASTCARSATPSSATRATAGPGSRSPWRGPSCTPRRSSSHHPVTGEPLSFRSPLPDDLAEVLGRLSRGARELGDRARASRPDRVTWPRCPPA